MTIEKQAVSLEDAVRICTQLYNEKKYDDCEKVANNILSHDQNNLDGKFFLALTCYENKNYEKSEEYALECLNSFPNNTNILFLLARLNKAKGHAKEAIEYYEKVINLDSSNVPAINNVANLYNEIGNNDKALQYFTFLEKNGLKEAYLFNNMCLIYKRVGLLNDAILNALKAIEIDPNSFEAHQNAALTYILLAKNKQAIFHLERAIEINPEYPDLYKELHDILRKTCDWEKRKIIGKKMDELRKQENEKNINAENADYKNDIMDEDYLEISREHTQKLVKSAIDIYPRFTIDEKRKSTKNKRLKIGYISSDIKDHPVAHLMRGVFKNHNENNVETFLYSFSPTDKSGYQNTIKGHVDNYIDINHLSNFDTAKKIHSDEIDILVDLNGHTGTTRLETLALKPAPVQVNYLGYIGTMGADFIDYIITDEVVTPTEAQKFYDEKFVYMPDCYQANDNDLEISEEEITKEYEGLPEDKFIFCSFNQTYKIEPLMFETWMNILKRVPNSVLWLYCGSINDDDTLAVENIRKEAVKRGISEERLFFAKSMAPISKHLKRTTLADLALDTRLYNGGTVTSQTLWAGVPVITVQGKVFQSRMASSILNAIGLEDMVTHSLKEYEELAVELALNKGKLKTVKSRLEKNKLSKPLFNTELFTSNLETAYRKMWENYCDGNEPKQIDLSAKQHSLPI